MMSNNNYIIGCDVGTGSVRAGVFTESGKMVAMSTHGIKTWRPQPDFVEQSSDNIWSACCSCVKKAVNDAGIDPGQIKGIGFDATCSLVVLDGEDQPLSVSPANKDSQNIIVWMDHRAVEEAEKINQANHEVLKYVGGSISPEMEIPKLLWLKSISRERGKKLENLWIWQILWYIDRQEKMCVRYALLPVNGRTWGMKRIHLLKKI